MKRLIKKSYEDRNLDIREVVLKTTPLYPSSTDQFSNEFQNNEFAESDAKSFSKMINDFSLNKEKNKDK